MDSIGRLKHTTSQKCSNCGFNLQLRARKVTQLFRGEELTSETDYLFCPMCEHEEEIKKQKKRKQTIDKADIDYSYLETQDTKKKR